VVEEVGPALQLAGRQQAVRCLRLRPRGTVFRLAVGREERTQHRQFARAGTRRAHRRREVALRFERLELRFALETGHCGHFLSFVSVG